MTPILPECARLAAELRLLRERSGLSLSALADESSYSKSSWQRYLAGRALPPWLAVRALCVLSDEPEPRLRAVWELAEAAWSRRGAIEVVEPTSGAERSASVDDRAAEPAAVPERAPARPSRWRVGAAAGVAVMLLAALLSLTSRAWTDADASGSSTAAFRVGCTGRACDGLDPGVEKCGVEQSPGMPKTLLHQQTPAGFGLEIRYSPMCRAAWARVWNTAVGDTLVFTAPGQPEQSRGIDSPSDAAGFVYTYLAAVTSRASRLTACLRTGADQPPKCFSALSP
ncbi:DUF2690 domain-containing protein [Streptomyces sp. NPDC051172]|uniref:helix-turn-helix domain-containing protein n=1 Tax=Streptomyces sp. NPDC051172 TaxID=3155796 RepID=UPI003417FFB7